jgi:hypothetical protein
MSLALVPDFSQGSSGAAKIFPAALEKTGVDK